METVETLVAFANAKGGSVYVGVFIITANPARIERWEYPLEALREIVLNMIVHRDYTHHGNSSIKIFPDRIEFFNPGHLPDRISISDLHKGTYVSDCRNKLVAKIFKEIEWIERYGTGIRRIKNYFKEYGSPEPRFENFQHGFMVTVFPLNVKDDNTFEKKDTEKDTEKTTLTQKMILQEISNNKFITIPELSEKVKIK
jgi:ATP-dependent DNA helicase RecG